MDVIERSLLAESFWPKWILRRKRRISFANRLITRLTSSLDMALNVGTRREGVKGGGPEITGKPVDLWDRLPVGSVVSSF